MGGGGGGSLVGRENSARYKNSAVEVLNSIKMSQGWRHNISGRKQPQRSHVKFNSLLQKNKNAWRS